MPLALDEGKRARCLAVLCEQERARAARFVRAEDRDRFIVSHAALRFVLARVLGAEPAALAFDADGSGKPRLGGPWHGRLAFNLSHSGRLAVIGFPPACRIGVDVEVVRPMSDALRIARHHFAPSEVAALAALPAEALDAAFFACWTCKEAFVKALGLGLSMRLDRFSVAIPPEPAGLLDIDGDPHAAARWCLKRFAAEPDHAMAVAVEHPSPVFRTLGLPPDWPDALPGWRASR